MTAAELKTLAEQAEQREAALTVAGVCSVVGVGVGAVQSRGRDADTAKKRAVVAWVLADRMKWPLGKVAQAVGRTPKQARRLIRQENGSYVPEVGT